MDSIAQKSARRLVVASYVGSGALVLAVVATMLVATVVGRSEAAGWIMIRWVPIGWGVALVMSVCALFMATTTVAEDGWRPKLMFVLAAFHTVTVLAPVLLSLHGR